MTWTTIRSFTRSLRHTTVCIDLAVPAFHGQRGTDCAPSAVLAVGPLRPQAVCRWKAGAAGATMWTVIEELDFYEHDDHPENQQE